jgi:hypothetical protein
MTQPIAFSQPPSHLSIMTSSSDTITFGPPSSQWHYHRPTKTYDLSRPSSSPNPKSKKFTLSTTHGPPDTKITISPDLSAFVIVDMQNFFLSPKCRDHPLGLEAVKPTIRVIEKCREIGIQVLPLSSPFDPLSLHAPWIRDTIIA